MAPTIIFGTATFGMDMSSFQGVQSVQQLLDVLEELGVSRLDTAPRYPPLKPGRAEELLGGVRKDGFVIDTKVFTAGGGALSLAQMDDSISKSLARLMVDKVGWGF